MVLIRSGARCMAVVPEICLLVNKIAKGSAVSQAATSALSPVIHAAAVRRRVGVRRRRSTPWLIARGKIN
jgi:hypothetical protein